MIKVTKLSKDKLINAYYFEFELIFNFKILLIN
jgi:hypothetical protein